MAVGNNDDDDDDGGDVQYTVISLIKGDMIKGGETASRRMS